MGPKGRPPTITKSDVVEAAVALDGPLTMTAVADRLEVTHAALYHHVRNVHELRSLVANHRLVELEVPDVAPWDQMLRRAAADFRAAQLDLGELQDVGALTPSVVQWFAGLTTRLEQTGFDREVAARFVHLLTSVVWANARDQLTREGGGDHPQLVEFRRAAADIDPTTAELVDAMDDPDARFTFDVESVIAAARARLEQVDGTGP